MSATMFEKVLPIFLGALGIFELLGAARDGLGYPADAFGPVLPLTEEPNPSAGFKRLKVCWLIWLGLARIFLAIDLHRRGKLIKIMAEDEDAELQEFQVTAADDLDDDADDEDTNESQIDAEFAKCTGSGSPTLFRLVLSMHIAEWFMFLWSASDAGILKSAQAAILAGKLPEKDVLAGLVMLGVVFVPILFQLLTYKSFTKAIHSEEVMVLVIDSDDDDDYEFEEHDEMEIDEDELEDVTSWYCRLCGDSVHLAEMAQHASFHDDEAEDDMFTENEQDEKEVESAGEESEEEEPEPEPEPEPVPVPRKRGRPKKAAPKKKAASPKKKASPKAPRRSSRSNRGRKKSIATPDSVLSKSRR